MADHVWVVVEHNQGEVDSVTFEMLDEGRKIANRRQSELVAVLLGHELPDISIDLAGYGADTVYVVDHQLLAQYTTDAYASALVKLISERKPFLVFQAATANGHDLAPRLAARLGAGLASDCVMVKLNLDGAVEATRPTHCDKAYTTLVLTSPPPFLATLRPGAIGVGKPDPSRRAKVEKVDVQIDVGRLRARSIKTVKAAPSTLDISEAEIIVAGGRGLGGTESWHLVDELADALDACVAGSRMALDAGWITRERLVGQSGKSVSPKVYFAVGISGAREHVAGTRGAKNLVAINKDPQAQIFYAAEKKVVGDLNEVIPALVRKLRQLRQAKAESGEIPRQGR